MERSEATEKLTGKFIAFCEKLGFSPYQSEFGSLWASVIMVKGHGLEMSLDLRDCYLNLYVVRLVDGKLPESRGQYYIDKDGRLYRIPVRDVYQTDEPRYTGENRYSEEAVQYVLDQYLAMIAGAPDVLFDYFAHMEEHTTAEKTRQFKLNAKIEQINCLKREYKEGRIPAILYKRFYLDIIKGRGLW